MRLVEHRSHPRGLADLLIYSSLVDDGVLLQMDGSLLTGWWFRGPDMMSSTFAEMEALSARLNASLRLGTGWMIQCDAIRSRAPEYPEPGFFPDSVTRVIDDERRQQFMAEGAHFESDYFLTLTWLPPVEAEERLKGWMFDGRGKQGSDSARRLLDQFRSRIESFENVLGSLFRIERLMTESIVTEVGPPFQTDRLLRYLRRCITAEDHPFASVEIPAYLNDVVAVQDFRGGIEPRIGAKHIRAPRSSRSTKATRSTF